MVGGVVGGIQQLPAKILFIIVNGIFPFKVASRNEWYFRLLCDKKYAEYWRATQA